MKASLGSCQGGEEDRAVSRRTEGHMCNLHRPREGLRPSPEIWRDRAPDAHRHDMGASTG